MALLPRSTVDPMLGGRQPSLRVLAALGLVTACTLAFQVVFTRLMSSVLAYHFSFLAVSLALLGTGAGALLIYVRPAWFEGPSLERTLARWTAWYALLLIAGPFVLVRLDFALDESVTFWFGLNLAVACLVAAAPSLAAGAVVALAIRGYPEAIGRVYAWDLVGAGIGALAIVPLLYFPAPNLLVGLGVTAAVAAAFFGWGDLRTRQRGTRIALGGLAILLLAGVTSVLYLPTGYEAFGESERMADEWHPLSRVQAYPNEVLGSSMLFYDRVFAPVPVVEPGEESPDWRDLELGPPSIGYEITGPGDALIIGGGGGRDIHNALSADQRVDVIELNSAIVDVVDENMAELSASPYSLPGVSTTIGDGRAILAERDKRYDQIHVGFTDTLSANAAQGFALTENNLYTLEAFDEYFDHLTRDGILNVSRLEWLVGDEALRATVLTMAALDRRGIENPSRHMVVIRGVDPAASVGGTYATILARLTPFTGEELREIRALARERGEGVIMGPGGPYVDHWRELHEAPSWQSFCNDYHLNVCPPTDDKPFFFNMRRLTDVRGNISRFHYSIDPYQILVLTLLILVVLSVVGLVLPLRLARTSERPRLPSLIYFAAIGLGFLLLEIVLIQRFVLFLGFPTYALSVVLFALLIFTGIGSALSGRMAHTRRSLTTLLGVAVGLIVIGAFTLQPLLRGLIDQPFALRVMLTIAILAPFGLVLGMPMPMGLTRFSALYPSSIPYAWGVNGIASVLASVLGIAVAINFGYVASSLVAALCYTVALGHAAYGRWATPAAGEQGDEDEVGTAAPPEAASDGEDDALPAATPA
jgi:hypothetical protein